MTDHALTEEEAALALLRMANLATGQTTVEFRCRDGYRFNEIVGLGRDGLPPIYTVPFALEPQRLFRKDFLRTYDRRSARFVYVETERWA